MMLTEQERKYFSDFCQAEALSILGLVKQMESLPMGIPSAVAQRYRARAAAYALVANELRSIEDAKIGE